ncbi:hypothetical protein CUC08_Gglean008135 [Alternaria sp. MG1]|jgi:hypothetical protein|nr:hypothetical protein CUC08_Gglean008135 [Alternaria sp. MG1]
MPAASSSDVTSRDSKEADEQIYITTLGQRAWVSVFVGARAGDTKFNEFIPNLYVGQLYGKNEEDRHLAVNISHKSLVSASAHGNRSLCNAPYTTTITYLPEALAQVRVCARDGADYTNPGQGFAPPVGDRRRFETTTI